MADKTYFAYTSHEVTSHVVLIFLALSVIITVVLIGVFNNWYNRWDGINKWRSRMNLLIIDDDKDLLRLLELTFKKEYNVDLYDSAEKIVPEQLVKI